MSQRESKLSRSIAAQLRLKGCFVFKVWGNEHMMVGLPDLIGCCKGRFFGLEVKLPENRKGTSAMQERVMQLIRDAGGTSQVVCTPQEAFKVLGLTNESVIAPRASRRPRIARDAAE